MKIKSNFKDYYDIYYHHDDDLLYVRTERGVEGENLGYMGCSWNHNSVFTYDEVRVAFCGRLYMGIKFYKDTDKSLTKYLYTEDEVEQFYKSMGWKWREKSYWNYGQRLWERFDKLDEQRLAITPLFEKYQTPILTCTSGEMIEIVRDKKGYKRKWTEDVRINTRLNQFNFQTVFNPQAAYQEISMFLGNMRKLERPIPHIDDVTLAEAKGFDKWSFRKEPSK